MEIFIDDSGYYTLDFENGTMVEITGELPVIENLEFLRAYKYNRTLKTLRLDRDKLKEIKKELGLEEDRDPTNIDLLNEINECKDRIKVLEDQIQLLFQTRTGD